MLQAIFFLLGALLTRLLIPPVARLLTAGNMTRENFEGRIIPVGMGLLLLPIQGSCLVLQLLVGIQEPASQLLWLSAVTGTALVGLVDDGLGNRRVLGFRGHVKALGQGILTTGGLKLILGGLLALISAFFLGRSPGERLLLLLLLGLSTNLINLLDLRPGRALKVFFPLGLLLMLKGAPSIFQLQFAPILGFSLAYFPFDLKARGMLGDTGANPLGMALGLLAARSLSMNGLKIAVVVLLLLHGLLERYSLTEIIENHGWLRALDRLGRR